jgi:mannose-6-phosphate isomerase-like protein (cupin superfamily)
MISSSAVSNAADFVVVPPAAGESWWIATDHQVMKLTSASTRGAVSLWFETVPPGGGPPPHVHQAEDEVFIVMAGKITFRSGDRCWAVKAGTVIFAPRGIPHSFQNTGDRAARMIGFVTPGGFDEYFRETAFRWADRECRPPIQSVEFDRLMEAAPRYGLEFQVPTSHEETVTLP